MAIDFGLHKRGFIAPTYEEVLDSVEDDFTQKFGEDIVLTSNSNFGIIARLVAWRETLMIQELQKTYYSAFISTASDSSLDRIGANLDLPRKSATYAFTTLKFVTDDEYLIQAGEQFETDEGIVFDLTEDVITAKDKDGTYVGYGNAQSVEKGNFNNVPANSITVVSNPDEDITSVTNPDKASGGQDYEEDPNYRARLIMENIAKPGPTPAGIKSALMNLPGVRQVNVVENPSADADKYGNPPYSVHVFILGGKAQDIAECLVDKVAAGISLVGTQEIEAEDATKTKRTVKFDFAKEKKVYAKVKLRTTEEWNLDEGVNYIKSDISDYVNSLLMGNTVYLTKIYPEIYQIPGVGEAIVQIGTDPNNLGSQDIQVDPFEATVCSPENIEVEVNGL